MMIGKLLMLGIKRKILSQICDGTSPEEIIVGTVDLSFKRHVVFTSHRIISISKIPLVGINTEWRGRKIVVMGGNFQIPYINLSGICRANTRLNNHVAIHGNIHPIVFKVLKSVGPSISKNIWPYEVQMIDRSNDVINRIYGISEAQILKTRELSAEAGLHFSVE